VAFGATGAWLYSMSAALTVSNQGVGDLLIVEVINFSNSTVWATGLTGGGATWTMAGVKFSGTTNNYAASVFLGTVTSTGAGTVTPTWSGTAPGTYSLTGHEFTSSVGNWAFDQQANLDSAGTLSWPSLTPVVNGELYFGMSGSFSASAGTTAGYVYNSDANGDGEAYNLSCPSGTGTFPVWAGTVGSNGMVFGIMILVKEVALTSPLVDSPVPVNIPVILAGRAGWRNAGHSR